MYPKHGQQISSSPNFLDACTAELASRYNVPHKLFRWVLGRVSSPLASFVLNVQAPLMHKPVWHGENRYALTSEE
jgi:hypothetical protein